MLAHLRTVDSTIDLTMCAERFDHARQEAESSSHGKSATFGFGPSDARARARRPVAPEAIPPEVTCHDVNYPLIGRGERVSC